MSRSGQPVPTARALLLGPVLEPLVQEEREVAFFSSIRLENGTYKATASHRLDDLNALLLNLLPDAGPLKVMDVAVSSGVTTLELLNTLESAGIHCEITAGDKSLTALLITIADSLAVLVDGSGCPLQFDIFGRAIPNPPGGRNLLRHWAPLFLLKSAKWLCFDRLRPNSDSIRPLSWQRLGVRCRSLALVSPRLKSRPNLTLIEDDILTNRAIRGSFHIIRAANILNKAYFDDRVLHDMLLNLHSRLLQRGLLAVCRTEEDGANHGTIFRENGKGQFDVAAQLGHGSEIESNVLAVGHN
jgi:hypothetical protein